VVNPCDAYVIEGGENKYGDGKNKGDSGHQEAAWLSGLHMEGLIRFVSGYRSRVLRREAITQAP
jgi:hypothetical protein